MHVLPPQLLAWLSRLRAIPGCAIAWLLEQAGYRVPRPFGPAAPRKGRA